MGFRSKLKAKIKAAIGNADALAKVIHEEALHPGRPQPHMAAKNPLWGGEHSKKIEDDEQEHSEENTVNTTVERSAPVEKDTKDDAFWFLKEDGEEGDDWSKVNPKKE